MRDLTPDDFDFALPPELIAQAPAPERTASRLLDVAPDALHDRRFADIERLLAPGDLLVANDTQVMHARLFGRKASGGAVEVLVERILDHERVLAMVRASKAPLPGSVLRMADGFDVQVLGREHDFFVLRFPGEPAALIERHGRLPLPPYITHTPTADDEQRYQTVFARALGAVAAPTAGLHFDTALLQRLQARGVQQARVTLHVGAGTFAPVRVARIAEHRMHREWFDVPQATVDAVAATRARGGQVVAVGTTTLRALESAARGGALVAGAQETDIFITPGFHFRVVDQLVTNFHLPKSTLMMLVSAFAGHARIMAAYRHAVAQRYRFFSYGDAMLLRRAAPEA
ncbi:MAG: tRNA preQ1(34) S-adenosylmethionine ribosyltransferase-isomerase QueA [Betaproteobacteria bacterium]|nr:tRNA preQ1(34) S-adenosylmethionine ribosyltransferase-isomerase QueA [Betaproteobacteria bacterium]